MSDNELLGEYYMWVEGGAVEGRLLLMPGVDEVGAIEALISACGNYDGRSEPAAGAVDPDAPTALIRVHSLGGSLGGVGYGALGRPVEDLLPLRTLVSLALDALQRQLTLARARGAGEDA